MCFPRWFAVAETAWNGGTSKGYMNFLETTQFYCDILKEIDRDLVKGALAGAKFQEYFFANCKCPEIKAAVEKLLK